MLKTIVVVFSLSLLAACSGLPGEHPVDAKKAPGMLFADHSLVDKIWDVKAKQFIDRQQLAAAITRSDYVLLGETHDNPKHHEYQAWAVAQLRHQQRSASVAFEMISQQQGQVIAGKRYDSVASLINALNHIKSNWDYEQFYKPILEQAVQAGYAVLPGNFDREQIMMIARQGEAKLPAAIKTVLDENPLPAEQAAALRKEIEGSHCGMINDKMTAAMTLVQRAKDAEMAEALRGSAQVNTHVLVAGSGHVRNDRGVPFYFRKRMAGKKLVSITWAEVLPGIENAKAYAAQWGAQQLPFDYVWFTPRMDRPDPCEGFRQHMKAKNQTKN